MPKESTSSIYQKLVTITNAYLGPAAERFINRQIENHLSKEPPDIKSGDLVELIDWLKLSLSMLTEDKEIVEEYTRELYKLASTSEQKDRTNNG